MGQVKSDTMWVAYIDESGSPRFNDPAEMFYTAAAIVIHDSRIDDLNSQIATLKKRILPARYRNLELHASEIVHGNKSYSGLKLDTRIRLMNELHEYISTNENITIISVVIDKKSIVERIGDKINLRRNIFSEKTRRLLYKLLLERLAWFITNIKQDRGSKWMLLIIDESTLVNQKRTTGDLDQEKQSGIYASKIPGSKYILFPKLLLQT